MSKNRNSFFKRRQRARTKIKLVSDRARLSVFKSGRHIYAQVIDDEISKTIAFASSLEKDINKVGKSNCNIENAVKVGKLIGERASKMGVTKVVFDRGGNKYHGVVKALAEEARKSINF